MVAKHVLTALIMVLPAIPQAEWLDGYSYRRWHVINPAPGVGRGYPMTITIDWRRMQVPRESGGLMVRTDLLEYVPGVNDTVIFEHDLLKDQEHYDTAVVAELTKGTSWAAAGAGCILKEGDKYYIGCRQRGGGFSGERWQVWESTDLSNWKRTWTVGQVDIVDPPEDVVSLEGLDITRDGNMYFLHFCTRGGTSEWQIWYVTAPTILALADSLREGRSWHSIIAGGHKDPKVFECEGKWYMLHNDNQGPRGVQLWRSNDLTFASYTVLDSLENAYEDSFGTSYHGPGSPGMILYDVKSGKFIFWGSIWEVEKVAYEAVYWYWCVAESLAGDWTFVARQRMMENYEMTNTMRHFDLWALSESRYVFSMEWDNDVDTVGTTFVWNYTSSSSGIETERVYLEGKCRYDFSDICVTGDDRIIPLWSCFVEKVDSCFATVLVLIDDDLGFEPETLWIYYGDDPSPRGVKGTPPLVSENWLERSSTTMPAAWSYFGPSQWAVYPPEPRPTHGGWGEEEYYGKSRS